MGGQNYWFSVGAPVPELQVKKDLLDGNERKDQKVPVKIAARFGDMGLRDRRLKGR